MYKLDERETILNYDPIDGLWHAWTSIPADIRLLKKRNWTLIKETIQDGVVVDATFTGARRDVSIRDALRAKPVGGFKKKNTEDEEIVEEE